MPLSTEEKIAITEKQVSEVIPAVKAAMKDYPDFIILSVHESNELAMFATGNSTAKVNNWFTDVLINNREWFNYFESIVIRAKKEIHKSK